MDCNGDEVLEGDWPAPRQAAAAAPRRRELLRVGPLALPVAAVAWGLSVSAHAALVAVALTVWRAAPRDAPPNVQFARGEGGTGFGLYRSGGEGIDSEDLVLPGVIAAGASLMTPTTEAENLDVEVNFPPPALAETWLGEAATDAVIGVPTSPGAPAFPVRQPPAVVGDAAGEGSGREGTPGVAGGVASTGLPAPVYPRESRRRGEQGTVVLEVAVSVDGTVTAVRVIDSAGYPRLAAAAVDAVKDHTFPPATRAGRPEACTLRIPFRFRLK